VSRKLAGFQRLRVVAGDYVNQLTGDTGVFDNRSTPVPSVLASAFRFFRAD
jgi:hypothetical protein